MELNARIVVVRRAANPVLEVSTSENSLTRYLSTVKMTQNTISFSSSSGSEDELTKNPSSRGVSTEDQTEDTSTQKNDNDPQQLLFSSSSDSDDNHCRLVRIPDEGSRNMCVKLQVEGVPVFGLIDTGADITIIGGTLFKQVASAARLKKKNFKPADKTPRSYDGRC